MVWTTCLGSRSDTKLKFGWKVPKDSPVIGVSDRNSAMRNCLFYVMRLPWYIQQYVLVSVLLSFLCVLFRVFRVSFQPQCLRVVHSLLEGTTVVVVVAPAAGSCARAKEA